MKEKYDDLAKNYDHTLVDVVGYPDPEKVTEALAEVLKIPHTATILDFGCGTGLVGQKLKERGYTQVVGMDASPEMLRVAEEKKSYIELKEVYLCRDEIPKEYHANFDIAVSAGLLAHDHVDGSVLDEKLLTINPASEHGYLVFTTREEYLVTLGYGKKIEELEKAGRLKFVQKLPFVRYQNAKDEQIGRFKPVEVSVFIYKALFP